MAVKSGGPAVYPIGSVMRQTGLTGRQIRYYEQMQLIDPMRSKGNQRLYSDTDVAQLLRIKTLLDDGYNVDGVRALLSNPAGEASGDEHVAPFGASVASVARPDGLEAGRAALAQNEDLPEESTLGSEFWEASGRSGISRSGLGPARLRSLYPVNNRAQLEDLLLSKHDETVEE